MEGGGGGGEGGWELITWEAFCPAAAEAEAAAAARMQMKGSSRRGGKGDGEDGPGVPRMGWHGCTQLQTPRLRAPLGPGGAVRLPGPGLRWIDW